jgi:hypothetical protein
LCSCFRLIFCSFPAKRAAGNLWYHFVQVVDVPASSWCVLDEQQPQQQQSSSSPAGAAQKPQPLNPPASAAAGSAAAAATRQPRPGKLLAISLALPEPTQEERQYKKGELIWRFGDRCKRVSVMVQPEKGARLACDSRQGTCYCCCCGTILIICVALHCVAPLYARFRCAAEQRSRHTLLPPRPW